MNKTLSVSILLIGTVGIFIFLKLNNPLKTTPPPSDLPIVNIQGDNGTVTFEGYGGKPIVINSWATWCTFCKKEILDFAKASVEHPDITFILINRGEPDITVQAFLTQQLGPLHHAIISILDPNDEFYRSIEGFSMPETLFVDANGTIVEHKRGFMTGEQIEEKLLLLTSP